MCNHREVLKNRALRELYTIAVSATICALVGVASGQSPLAQLKVISVRKMTEAEYSTRASDKIGARYVVRFRLEVSGDQGVYVLAGGPKGTPPLGYAVERNSSSIVWLDAARGEDRSKSPGVEKLTKELGASWILLPAAAAYEWEIEAECSGAGIDESRSVFIRKDMKRPPTELISSWYTVGDKQRSERDGRGGK
jgi:hypothetical protein